MRDIYELPPDLAGALVAKSDKLSVGCRICDLYGAAANFAVFDVGLLAVFRKINDHRDLLVAIRAFELLFDFKFHLFTYIFVQTKSSN